MPLSVGDKLGPYEILAPIGAGGMGEVYRAKDTNLDREVAIKVLPAALAQDAERLARFEREAKVLAALNHPNIAQIYGIEASSSGRALVMELVPGETLGDRIKRSALPLDEALTVARQIAEALEAAHEKGIVHRDLKPGNVMITPSGVVKVLDYGLAAVTQPTASTPGDPNNSPTLTMGMTQAGAILGTAAYMAPEQAAGSPVDRRADIWSYGVVLWEILTGQRLFAGDSVAHILADVLRQPLEFDKVTAPAPIKNLLRRCLDRDVKNRLQWIGEARIAIDGVGKEIEKPTVLPSPARARLGAWAWAAAAIVGIATAAGLAFVHFREPQQGVVKLEFPPPEKGTFIQNADQPAVSPDGRRVVFAAIVDGKRTLWVRDLDSPTARMLPGTEIAAAPFWAPDSRQVAFFTITEASRLMKIDVTGGPPVTVIPVAGGGTRSGTWNQDNVILFGQAGPNRAGPSLFRVSAGGGTPAPATELDKSRKETSHRWPHFLPDGRHFLYTAASSETDKTGIFVGDLQSKDRKLVVLVASNALYVESSGGHGYVLFVRDGTLMAQPFDPSKLETSGDAVPIAEHVEFRATTVSAYFGASRNGVLAYTSGSANADLQITWFDRSGKVVGTIGKPVDTQTPRLSPNGRMVATDRRDLQSNDRDIWLYDLVRGTEQRLTFAGNNMFPVWSPDGLRIAYSRRTDGKLLVKSADGTGPEEVLEAFDKAPSDWSHDSGWLLTMTSGTNPKTGSDVWALPLSGPNARTPVAVRQTEFSEGWARVSPDGRWLAYHSNESKRFEVYVVGFPSLNGHWQVSTYGGRLPVWSRDGRELYFVSQDNKLMAVDLQQSGTQFQAGVPKPLFDVRLGSTNPSYDVSADGRFLIATPIEQFAPVPMTIVLNWTAALKK